MAPRNAKVGHGSSGAGQKAGAHKGGHVGQVNMRSGSAPTISEGGAARAAYMYA